MCLCDHLRSKVSWINVILKPFRSSNTLLKCWTEREDKTPSKNSSKRYGIELVIALLNSRCSIQLDDVDCKQGCFCIAKSDLATLTAGLTNVADDGELHRLLIGGVPFLLARLFAHADLRDHATLSPKPNCQFNILRRQDSVCLHPHHFVNSGTFQGKWPQVTPVTLNLINY